MDEMEAVCGRLVAADRSRQMIRAGQRRIAPPHNGGYSLEFLLPLRHFGPGGFEDAPLAFGQALDAVSGNFVQDRIDLAANKLRWRQILGVASFGSLPKWAFGERGGH